MKTNLYALVNKVDGGTVVSVSIAANDGICVRDNLPALKRLFPYVLDDMEFVQIGEVSDGAVCTYVAPRSVDWKSYNFPENPVKPLSESEQQKLRENK